MLEDLDSRNGVWVDGRRVERARLHGAVDVRLGDDQAGSLLKVTVTAGTTHQGIDRRVIGRDPSAWLQVSDPMASWQHARIDVERDTWWVTDLDSTNGTVVNGSTIETERQRLVDGDRLLIGNTRLFFHRSALHRDEGDGFVVKDASLALRGGRRIVEGVSFSIPRPSLVAVIGPSGAGKSSLLRLITGQVDPSDGEVTLHGATMTSQRRAHRGQIGVVPQHTVAHTSLTARRALDYTARLRLASDVSGDERRQIVQAVLESLGLGPHADTRMSRLSGGQQRRVGIAMEMLTDPDMLVLDEPTAGLDPSLVLQIMDVLRGLADAGKLVLLVTHDLDHLNKVDNVLVLRAGGTPAYYGPPSGVFAYFGTATWAETFELLAEPAPQSVHRRPTSGERSTAHDLPASAPGLRSALTHAGVVLRRQLRLITSDPLYLALLVGMPLVLGCLALAVPGSDGLGPTTNPANAEAQRLLVLLVVGAAFLGLSAPIRDLVGERPIYQHERDAGLSPASYLSAKVVVFAIVAAVQALLLVGLVLLARTGPEDALVLGSPDAELVCAVIATALTNVALGLAVSSRVTTTEQSMPPLVLLVMGQLVMCGGLFPIAGRGVLPALSWAFPTRWGYAAAGSTVDLNNISQTADPDDLWVHTASNWAGCMLIMAVLGVIFLAIAARGVSRRRRFP